MFTNTRTLTIEWGDCDPAGIVFYPRYFEMFDVSTITLMTVAMHERKKELLHRHGALGFPMVATETHFHAPCSYGDEVKISSTITHLGKSSFKLQHRLFHDGQLCVETNETRVWVVRHPKDPDRIKSAPLPADIVTALSRAP